MNTIVFNKLSGTVLFEDRSAPERDRGGRPYGGVLDSPHARPDVGIPDGPHLKDNLGLRHRRTGYANAPRGPARLHPGGVEAASGEGIKWKGPADREVWSFPKRARLSLLARASLSKGVASQSGESIS
jgi:hypothetical protein